MHMIHYTEKEHYVQLVSKEENATATQDMKAVTPVRVEIISRGSRGLRQRVASQESTSKTPYREGKSFRMQGGKLQLTGRAEPILLR